MVHLFWINTILPSVVHDPSGGGFIWYGIGGLFESEPSSSPSSSSNRPIDKIHIHVK